MADRSARLAGSLAGRGVRKGDVVLTLVGNRPEWVYAMVACFRIGAVALPCTEQLRPADLRMRIELVDPRAAVADERNAEALEQAGFDGPVLTVPDERLYDSAPAPAADLAPDEPALVVFTSGTAGEPKPIRHGQGYLPGQRVQAEHWFGAREGDLCWCTAASGWSKSARNVFIAPWLRGAAALLHDARFDPEERLEIVEREGVAVLCMAPTEYRAVAKRAQLRPLPSLRHAVAAGEPLNPEIVNIWSEEAGVGVHDGYGQTETGALTGMPIGPPVRPGSMGRALPGFRLWIDEGELCADPETVPTFFLDGPRDRLAHRRPGQPGRGRLPLVRGPHRRRDHLRRLPDRAVRGGVGARGPPAVAEAAAVAAPDDVRGQVVRAIVVLRDGFEGSDELVRELQDHAREQTAPYKYPRLVEFSDSLPKTASGKIKRAELRRE